MTIVESLADAITRQEGYAPGTRAYRNNNPGNLWDGITTGKTKRIWPSIPIDDQGFLIYPSQAAGRTALEHDLTIKIGRGMDLSDLISQYAPPAGNDTATYIRNVSTWLGIAEDVPLNSISTSTPSPGFPEGPLRPPLRRT